MELYEDGKLDRKWAHNKLAIHATYFDFLYNFNVREQEDEVFGLLNNIFLDRKRPERRQNKQGHKVKNLL